MTDQGVRAVAAVGRLRLALEQTAAALASPRLDALLAGETSVELALSDLSRIEALSRDEQQALRGEIEQAGDALLRCRRLGVALGDFVRISLEAQGRGAEYGPRPAAAMSYAGQTLNTRV